MFSISIVAALAIAFLITQLANLVTTVYLHRTLAHRSMTLSRPVEVAMRAVLWLTMGIDRREWVAVHRKHHVFSDQPQDPHSPVQRGVWQVTFLNVVYYRREAKRNDTIQTFGRDLAPDRIERVLFSRGLLGVGIGFVVLGLLFGWATAATIGAVHTVLYIFLGGCVNGLGHWFGNRPHETQATNQRWLAVLTAGEGMHNEHHQYPRSPRFGSTWWDIGGKFSAGLARLRLASMHESSRFARDQDRDLGAGLEPVGATG